MSEVELQIWNTLMRVPHGNIQSALEDHKMMRDQNPLFYVKCATWYCEKGSVRDHKVVFVRALFEAKNETLREAGWALLQELPFHLMSQVVMGKNPRSLRSAVIHYLTEMGDGELSFQIIRGAKELRRLVRRLHIPTLRRKDGGSVHPNLLKIGVELFSKKPELRTIFKKLYDAKTPEEVAELLSKTNVPAFIAVSSIRVRTPEIIRVLIEKMSVSELLQSMNTLGRLKAITPNMGLIRNKIQRALDDKRLNIGRIRNIQKKLDAELVPGAVFDQLTFITHERTKKESKISKKIAIMFDTSSSMDRSIVTARQLAVTLALACKEKPLMFTASSTPYQIDPKEWTYEYVEKMMELVRPAGMTPLGSGLALLRKTEAEVDTIILISDLEENSPPFFTPLFLEMYAPATIPVSIPDPPGLILAQVPGGSDHLTPELKKARINYELISIETVDQYSIDQIVQIVGKGSPFDQIMRIMEYEIPQRPPETKVPRYWEA